MPVTYRLLAEVLLPLTNLLQSADGLPILSSDQLITPSRAVAAVAVAAATLTMVTTWTSWSASAARCDDQEMARSRLAKMATLPAETLIGNANPERRGNASSADACAGEVDAQHRLFRHRRFCRDRACADCVVARGRHQHHDLAEQRRATGDLQQRKRRGVTSFNTRTGAVTLSSADVTGALGYTRASSRTTAARQARRLMATAGSIPTPASCTSTSTTAPRRSGWSCEHRLSDLAGGGRQLHFQRPHLAVERQRLGAHRVINFPTRRRSMTSTPTSVARGCGTARAGSARSTRARGVGIHSAGR